MKKSFLLSTFLLISLLLSDVKQVKADWVQVNNGLGLRSVNTLCSYTSGGVNYIFEGTRYGSGSGVFVSTNNGDSWSLSWRIPNDVWALTQSGNYLYMGCSNGLGYTTNNGANWYDGALGHWIYSLASNGSNIFAGLAYSTFDPGGLYVSTNYGANWTKTSHPDAEVNGIAINGNNIFTAAGGGQNLVVGVFRSTDYGLNWIQTPLNNTTILSLLINGTNIFAGTSSLGVYLSTNNGTNWTHTVLNDVSIYTLIAYNNYIFAGGFANGGGFYVSSDSGASWVQRPEGMGSCVTLSISNGYLFAGTSGTGIYRRPISELVGIEKISNAVPTTFDFKQNYPNPFNPTTKIKFSIPKKGFVQLKVFDVLGRERETLVNQDLNAAEYEVTFDGTNYASGVYFYQLTVTSGQQVVSSETKKLVLIK